jgi:hypothetical protein
VQPVDERSEAGLTLLDRRTLVVSERHGDEHALEVLGALEELGAARGLRDVEVAASTCHAMRTLLEEGVAAV